MSETLIDIDQLAGMLNRTPEAIYQSRKRAPNTLPPNAFKIGRKVYWRQSTVEAWFESLESTQNAVA
jgi:predicted DNA-binding transcriptional regulator AlpA